MPSARVTRYRSTRASIVSVMKCTLPSHTMTFAPPLWKLKISSFGPQLLTSQVQPLGPPTGLALLLMTGLEPAVAFGGPETPLPLSGSAQRFNARLPLGVGVSAALPAAT